MRRTFCSRCLGVLQKLKGAFYQSDSTVVLLHHDRATDLRDAAVAGCLVCSVLWGQLNQVQQERLLASDKNYEPFDPLPDMPPMEWDDEASWKMRGDALERQVTNAAISIGSEFLQHTEAESITLHVTISSEWKLADVVDDEDCTAARFMLEPMTPLVCAEVAANDATPRAGNTDSAETWAQVEHWLDQCLTRHKRCNVVRTGDWYPTRLLDLGHHPDYVKLVETASGAAAGRYMTLSHRWGSSRPTALLRSTVDEFVGGMAISRLPVVFQEAVGLCKRLNVRFLWIDSMCIMQDSDDLSDWVREAALMHKVYSNSFLNISALAAADSDHSLYAQRDPDIFAETCIRTQLAGLSVVEEWLTYRVTNMMFWKTQLNQAHLNMRGWVLQERLLAPRVVHFGNPQVFWECHEFDASESFPRGLPKYMDAFTQVVRSKDIDSDSIIYKQGGSPSASLKAWSRIVMNYSRCGLTKLDDKMIALSGIAKYMAATLDDEYVAGMWRRSLPWELTWSVDCTEGPEIPLQPPQRRRAEKYRAPSFSWASVEAPVSPSVPDDSTAHIDILDVQQSFLTEDQTGVITGATLTVRGSLRKLTLKWHAHQLLTWKLLMEVNGVEVRQREGPESDRIGPLIALDEHHAFYDPTTSQDLYIMFARSWGTGSTSKWLLLELVNGAEAAYRRVGLATSTKQEEFDLLQQAPRLPEEIPAVSFVEGLHTIRLV